MSEENLIRLISFKTTIKEDGTFVYPVEEVKKIFHHGYNEIIVNIYTTTNNYIAKSGIDINLYQKIKDTQGIPEEIVINLIKSKGSLKNSNIKERLFNERKRTFSN
ncbi:MAG: hypothetical protein N2249_05190 [Melioribacter sp.]|nr:hypothetical protein [Melioribacter sp.]